jgi:pimeloyl-ACP methyl ester carboxylesterase
MTPRRAIYAATLATVTSAAAARADLGHETVSGVAVAQVSLERAGHGAAGVPWGELSRARTPGLHVVRFEARGAAVLVPHCNGRGRVLVDGAVKDPGSKGPLVLRLEGADAHAIAIEVKVSSYEKRVACSEPPRVGEVVRSDDGLSLLRFASAAKARGGGEAVVFVPGGHDRTRPAAVLVGVHPWNGTPWTYAAYAELLRAAGRRDVVLLMPSGLGNSLYVADAEEEVMRAIEALGGELAIDRHRVSIWGASMGGAGATTIGFHRPDRFAFVASYFGDSRYDLTTYVGPVLGGEAGAHAVNALDVLDNARHLPVFLVHGEDDRTSPVQQSVMLHDAMRRAGFAVELARVRGMGHEGPLVVRFIERVVERASAAVAPVYPARVSFRSVRAADTGAYGVRLVRAGERDAFVDLEGRDDGVHVLAAEGVKEIVLEPGALGARTGAPVVVEPGRPTPPVRWAP